MRRSIARPSPSRSSHRAETTDDLINDYKVNGRGTTSDVGRKVEMHLLPHFAERRRMTSITTDVSAFSGARQEAGTSNAEINRELAALHCSFHWQCAGRPARAVPACADVKENNVRKGFLDADPVKAAVASPASAHNSSPCASTRLP